MKASLKRAMVAFVVAVGSVLYIAIKIGAIPDAGLIKEEQ